MQESKHGGALPLWSMHAIRNTAAGGESALLVRVHHSIGDGVSLISVIDHVMQGLDGKSPNVR
jgi:Wax ester synthase-like Acyl-CoA acyltransferase domain